MSMSARARRDVISFLRDYLTILRAGVFMHSAYANRYLGTRKALPFALFHYLRIGEGRGHRPNPFYNPAHVADRLHGRGLAAYLRDDSLWPLAPCRQMDPVWYRAHAMTAAERGLSPFMHFWHRGFALDARPSAAFDLTFFKTVVAFYRPDKREFAFECFAAPDTIVPDDEAAFETRQAAFTATLTMQVLRRPDRPRSRYLVFVQASVEFVNPHRGGGTFDVMINYYDGATRHDETADYIVLQHGTKTTAIRKLLAEAGDIMLAYDAVLFLDDDIEIATADIERLFAIFATRRLDLAQASLTAESSCAFEIVKQPHAGDQVRGLTAVEIMMPVISRRALETCGFAFAEGVSGWAVDFLLSAEVRRRFGDRIALVGDVVATHRREVDLSEGAFYLFLRRQGIEATTEAGRIATRFCIEVSTRSIRAAPLAETASA